MLGRLFQLVQQQNKYVLVILRVCNRGVPGQRASCLFYKGVWCGVS